MKKFEKLSFPTIRNVYPSLIASKLVSVQPMTQPTGVTFYLYGGERERLKREMYNPNFDPDKLDKHDKEIFDKIMEESL